MKTVAVGYAPAGAGAGVGGPRLAAFGPSVATGVLERVAASTPIPRGRVHAVVAGAAQALVAATVGCLVLLAPISALSVAVEEVGSVRTLTAAQVVPGQAPMKVQAAVSLTPASVVRP